MTGRVRGVLARRRQRRYAAWVAEQNARGRRAALLRTLVVSEVHLSPGDVVVLPDRTPTPEEAEAAVLDAREAAAERGEGPVTRDWLQW